MIAQLLSRSVYVDLVVTTPKLQEIAPLLAAKAMIELANAMHGEFTALAGFGCATQWAGAPKCFATPLGGLPSHP